MDILLKILLIYCQLLTNIYYMLNIYYNFKKNTIYKDIVTITIIYKKRGVTINIS